MRVSELSRESGTSVATIKYYLREGLLHAGEAVNARQSSYDESHVARVRLVRGLVHTLGTSIEQVRQVLRVIDDPDQTVLEAMERATTAIPMAPDQAEKPGHSSGTAEALVQRLGFRYEPASPYLRALDTALALGDDLGISIDDEQIEAYAAASRQAAQADFARIPWNEPGKAVPFAVLGTALYEPVLLALRRLAHDELALLRADRESTDEHHEEEGSVHDEQR